MLKITSHDQSEGVSSEWDIWSLCVCVCLPVAVGCWSCWLVATVGLGYLGGTQEARDILEAKSVFSYVLFSAKVMQGTSFTKTGVTQPSPFTAPADKISRTQEATIGDQTSPNTEDTPPEPPQQRLFGESS